MAKYNQTGWGAAHETAQRIPPGFTDDALDLGGSTNTYGTEPDTPGLGQRAKDFVAGKKAPVSLSQSSETQLQRVHTWWEVLAEPQKGKATAAGMAKRQAVLLELMQEAGAPQEWLDQFALEGEKYSKKAGKITPSRLFRMEKTEAQAVARGLDKAQRAEFMTH